MSWKNRIEKLNNFIKVDNEIMDALHVFFGVVFPESYAPPIGFSQVDAYIAGLAREDEGLLDELEYLVYGAKNMGTAMVEHEGVSYDFKKEKDVVEYFEKFYPIK